MTCDHCGSRIPEDAESCPYCRAPVREPGLLERLFRWLGAPRKASPARVIRKTEIREQRFETVDAAGQRHVYRSLDEVPPDLRPRIEEALRAAEQDAAPGGSIRITVKDSSGRQQTYNSVEEMPPDIRAIYERIREDRRS